MKSGHHWRCSCLWMEILSRGIRPPHNRCFLCLFFGWNLFTSPYISTHIIIYSCLLCGKKQQPAIKPAVTTFLQQCRSRRKRQTIGNERWQTRSGAAREERKRRLKSSCLASEPPVASGRWSSWKSVCGEGHLTDYVPSHLEHGVCSCCFSARGIHYTFCFSFFFFCWAV